MSKDYYEQDSDLEEAFRKNSDEESTSGDDGEDEEKGVSRNGRVHI